MDKSMLYKGSFVVDDESRVMQYGSVFLMEVTPEGVRVIWRNTGEESAALAHTAREKGEVIRFALMDWNMLAYRTRIRDRQNG